MVPAQRSTDAIRATLATTGCLAGCPTAFVEAVLNAGLLRHLEPGEPLTVENEQMTPSLKARCHVLTKVYGERLKGLDGRAVADLAPLAL